MLWETPHRRRHHFTLQQPLEKLTVGELPSGKVSGDPVVAFPECGDDESHVVTSFTVYDEMTADLTYGVLLLAGLAGLIAAAEQVVAHSVRIVEERGVSGGVLGLTVISIGTSLPEILTHVLAGVNILRGELAREIASATVLGMNIGSDIVQQTFLVGLVALLGSVQVTDTFLKRDFTALIAAALLSWLAAVDGRISRWEGSILVVAYTGYLTLLVMQRRTATSAVEAEADEAEPAPMWVHAMWIGGGLLAVVLCGHVTLQGVDYFVERFALSSSLIGVTLIGISTTLPEMSTALSSLRKKQHGLSLGTLIGSNITNPTLGIGIGAMIAPYTVPKSVIVYDLPVKVFTAVIILGLFIRDRRLSRMEAILLIAAYFVYLAARMSWFSADVFTG